MALIRFDHDLRFESLAEVLRLFFGNVPQPELRAVAQLLKLEACPGMILSQEISPRGEDYAVATQGTFREATAAQRDASDARNLRKEAKRQLYLVLAELLNRREPWGALTGVRPTQVVLALLEDDGLTEKEAERTLIDKFGLYPEKAALALEVNRKEQEILRAVPDGSDMVYIGIPFCPSRCAYCSFIAQDARRYKGDLADYVAAIATDMDAVYARRSAPVSALYFGGGTPSALDLKDLESLLDHVFQKLPLADGAEVTFEAGRPDSLSPEKVRLLKSYPIQRICLNPQTLFDATLRRIGRHHTVAQFHEAHEWIQQAGFEMVNMDLICGLPGEDGATFLRSLDGVMALDPENITVHSLALKRSARLNQEGAKVAGTPDFVPQNKGQEAVLDRATDLFEAMETAHGKLREAGLLPYYLYRQKNLTAGLENTGFAKPGTASAYNVGMMSDRVSVLGFGAGASTKAVFGRRLERYVNVKDIGLYIERAAGEAQKKVDLFELD